jgi:N4-(beta-N-acetylglucosaminyl)-L-asparaginase
MTYYIVRKDGAYAGVTLWGGTPQHPTKFAVHDGTRRLENCVALYAGNSTNWPPTPKLE